MKIDEDKRICFKRRVGLNITISDYNFGRVREFKFLGQMPTENTDGTPSEIQDKIKMF